ncbi:hydrogenase nickel incorporation protein HypB [Niveibacterium sp. COAC-50]|uniref:hydrogenase nickel incorporation protein HypB n=1 Tax=Niveibacterium sp. COAC-50 TaxID=2729384 RepID=UPI001556FD77|nr:hydrogenase nickel incorporation protein HypB [Niveibacterium sp. COAC-50]
MCVTCGCGGGDAHIDGHGMRYARPRRGAATPPAATSFRPAHGTLDARHAPGTSEAQILRIEQDILSDNDTQANANRSRFLARGLFVLNFVSSPGSGKTTLLVDTIRRWGTRSPVAVVEGDQQTAFDAERIRATGAAAVQINTGKGCHLDAHMVAQAADQLAEQAQLPSDGLLLIENVGNLVCPAAFDLGEAHKVVILSVTEGEDKPLKYPDMFRAADLLLISKIDLLPHLDFDVDLAVRYARQVRPDLPVIQLSTRSGEGCEAWLDWLAAGVAAVTKAPAA